MPSRCRPLSMVGFHEGETNIFEKGWITELKELNSVRISVEEGIKLFARCSDGGISECVTSL